MAKVYDTDAGTTITLNTGQVVTAATVHVIKAQSPSGAISSLVCAIVDSTKLRHIKTASTLSQEGTWKLETYVEFGGPDNSYTGDPFYLMVYSSLKGQES